MSKIAMLDILRPSRALRGLRRHGVKNAALHVMRRLGAARERALVGPYLLRINPMGYVCNHTCPMCWLQHMPAEELKSEKKKDLKEGMKLEDYVRLFDSMPPGFEEVNIVGGGEPLIHAEIVGIMREVKRRGLRGWLITNASLLKEEIARAMVEIRWDVTRASVHAGDRETYQKIQGVDRFEILRENLKRFSALRHEAPGAKEKMEFVVLNVLQAENIERIDSLFGFAEDVGADRIVFEKVIPYSEGRQMTAEQYRNAREQLTAGARASHVPCNLDEILGNLIIEEACVREHKPFVPAARCSVGFDQSFITAQGEVLPCCFSNEVMGNVRTQSFRDIWRGEKYDRFRKALVNGKFRKYCIINHCAMKDVLHN